MIEFKEMEVCPLADSCNANICPIDPYFLDRKYIKGESICRWFRDDAKHGLNCNNCGTISTIRGIPISILAAEAKLRYKPMKTKLDSLSSNSEEAK